MGNVWSHLRTYITCLSGAVSLFVALPAQAATITDIYDQPSSLVVSEASNHKFVFTVASAVDEGDTITFTFETEFNVSLISEDDVDVADDGTDLTTTSSCTGSAQAAVSMSSSVMTIAICPGDGGAIAAGSSVTVEIGTNASASGSGTERITNPSTAATYFVALGGTFGDTASVPLPFVTANSSGVSGSVLPSGSSGGGGSSSSSTPDPDPDPEPEPEPEPEPDVDPDPDPEPEPEPAPAPDDEIADGGGGETPADDTPSDDGDGGTDTAEDGGDTSGGGGGTPIGGVADDAVAETDNGGNDDEAPVNNNNTANAETTIDAVIVTDGGLTLDPDGDTFDALAGSDTSVTVGVESDTPIAEVRIIIDEVVYILTPSGDGYTAHITIPASDAALTVEVEHEDGTVARETYRLDVRGGGLVYVIEQGERIPVSGAIVTVYEIRGGARIPWDAALYGASNPLTLGESGVFSWYVPNGTYIVSAEKSGFEDGTSSQITVRDHILAPSIELMRSKEAVPVPTEAATATPIVFVAAALTAFTDGLEALRELPQVQAATDIAGPAAVVLAATSVAVLTSSFSLLPFLQYVLTSPILFFARRKRKAFGTVYNAATKIPVDLAIVRLFAMPGHTLVRSVVTDQQGKYLLTAAPGTYIIEVLKPNHLFPSLLLKEKKDDGQYLDVYTGQEVVVSEKEASIAANIPLDPSGTTELVTPRHIAVKRFLRAFQHVVATVGIFLALGVLVFSPSIFTAIMVGVQLAVYCLVRRLARVRRPKGWGIVYDSGTRVPVGNTVVRLFEPTYNKLIETVLTDRFGRYAFLVGPSEYYVSYSKPGYTEKIVRPIDYRDKHEPSALALDVPIQEAEGDV